MPRSLSHSQYELFLSLLREVRLRQGVTQAALADALGFRQADISKVERGVRRLDVLELRAWVDALGVSFLAFASDLEAQLDAQDAISQADFSMPRG
jgi:transcriptional regulator with XRE-family HTH domain